MTDVVSAEKRSQMMSGIKSKNTKPELLIRKAIFKRGYRYKIHCKELPGKPDIVLPKYKAAVFVHGCFWHGHHCNLFKWPSSRSDFWYLKINSNKENDLKSISLLNLKGYRVLIVWECSIKGRGKMAFETIIDKICNWLSSPEQFYEIKGTL